MWRNRSRLLTLLLCGFMWFCVLLAPLRTAHFESVDLLWISVALLATWLFFGRVRGFRR